MPDFAPPADLILACQEGGYCPAPDPYCADYQTSAVYYGGVCHAGTCSWQTVKMRCVEPTYCFHGLCQPPPGG
jgi:hypothetical protein